MGSKIGIQISANPYLLNSDIKRNSTNGTASNKTVMEPINELLLNSLQTENNENCSHHSPKIIITYLRKEKSNDRSNNNYNFDPFLPFHKFFLFLLLNAHRNDLMDRNNSNKEIIEDSFNRIPSSNDIFVNNLKHISYMKNPAEEYHNVKHEIQRNLDENRYKPIDRQNETNNTINIRQIDKIEIKLNENLPQTNKNLTETKKKYAEEQENVKVLRDETINTTTASSTYTTDEFLLRSLNVNELGNKTEGILREDKNIHVEMITDKVEDLSNINDDMPMNIEKFFENISDKFKEIPNKFKDVPNKFKEVSNKFKQIPDKFEEMFMDDAITKVDDLYAKREDNPKTKGNVQRKSVKLSNAKGNSNKGFPKVSNAQILSDTSNVTFVNNTTQSNSGLSNELIKTQKFPDSNTAELPRANMTLVRFNNTSIIKVLHFEATNQSFKTPENLTFNDDNVTVKVNIKKTDKNLASNLQNAAIDLTENLTIAKLPKIIINKRNRRSHSNDAAAVTVNQKENSIINANFFMEEENEKVDEIQSGTNRPHSIIKKEDIIENKDLYFVLGEDIAPSKSTQVLNNLKHKFSDPGLNNNKIQTDETNVNTAGDDNLVENDMERMLKPMFNGLDNEIRNDFYVNKQMPENKKKHHHLVKVTLPTVICKYHIFSSADLENDYLIFIGIGLLLVILGFILRSSWCYRLFRQRSATLILQNNDTPENRT